MSVLSAKSIKDLFEKKSDERLIITPILENSQIGLTSVDLRLGTKFKVSIQTREPVMDPDLRSISTFFQDTYRDFGDKFYVYPNQLVLATTFEYIKIPCTHMGIIYTRSSYNRLGLQISSIVQPGYTGTLNLELYNKGENSICLTTGARIVQLLLFELSNADGESYILNNYAKYTYNTGPVVSGINEDEDLKILKKIEKKYKSHLSGD